MGTHEGREGEHEAAGDIASAVWKETATMAIANPLIFIQSKALTHETDQIPGRHLPSDDLAFAKESCPVLLP